MANFRTTNKKQLTARVLCALLLGTYLTGGYQPPVRAAALNVYGNTNITVDSGKFASAWGFGFGDFKVIATGQTATAWGNKSVASGDYSTAFGYSS